MIRKLARYLLSRNNLFGTGARSAVSFYEAIFGTVNGRKHFKKSMQRGRSVQAALEIIQQRWPNVKSPSAEKPVFILSSGWRCGSTMLQRLVMSKQPVLIWGEPYSHALMLRHMSDGISAITHDWPEQRWFVSEYELDKLDSTFVANLYPEITDLQQAYLAYMQSLFIDTAKTRGFDRWGIKDVRLTIDDARFLKWLYPQAKFLFLVRDPYKAYRSYRLTRDWYQEWPQDPVLTARRFGQHWRDLARGFHDGVDEIGGKLLRQEDLSAGEVDFAALETYLEIEINPALLNKKVGSHRRTGDTVPGYEHNMLAREVEAVAHLFGYK